MYKSDIRSMINFLQLNQNFKLDEWNKNILNNNVLQKLHNMFCDDTKQIDVIHYIYKISRDYNIDKKHLIQSFFNYIIRNTNIEITDDFTNYMKKIIHNINADMMDIIQYMIINKKYLMTVPCDA